MSPGFLRNGSKSYHSIHNLLRRHSTADSIGAPILRGRPHQQRQSKAYARLPNSIYRKTRELELSPRNIFSSSFCSSTVSSSSKIGVVGWYLGLVKSHPILTKSITCAFIYTVAGVTLCFTIVLIDPTHRGANPPVVIMPSSDSPTDQTNQYLQTLLESARPFLRGELESIDKNLPSLVAVLRSVGAGECWHKHGSFLDHLVDIYRILKLWKAPDSVCLCGLFHSAYSNSYVNLAIFDPSTGRDTVRAHVGEAAEHLIHLFCIVPRQPLIHDDLLFQYTTDSELVEHLKLSEISLRNAKERGLFDEDEAWRKKIQSLVPADGITVKHIKTGEDVLVSRRVVAVFLLMTMADFSDQLFGFQDVLFENSDGRLEFSGNNYAALWPGDGKPGLWMNSISRIGAIYSLIVREEEIFMENKRRNHHHGIGTGVLAATGTGTGGRDEEIELVIPPVFEKCTKVLDAGEQVLARDLYWEAVCGGGGGGGGVSNNKRGWLESAEEKLVGCVEKNPFIGEPHVVLGQLYLSKGRFEEAEREAEKGLTLMLEWGSPWDKRTSWEGWIAWARVLVMKTKERSWPHTSWGILNLGLVR